MALKGLCVNGMAFPGEQFGGKSAEISTALGNILTEPVAFFIGSVLAEVPKDSDYLSLSRYLSFLVIT